MKKQFFTFLMMIALVIMAGKAMAAAGDKFNPYPGGTYSYTLPITIANQSDATLTATGLTTGTSTLENISPSLTNIATTVTQITFDIDFSDNATGICVVAFSITDEVSTCSNNIFVNITMAAKPTYTLAIVKNEAGFSSCQKRTGAADNAADALGDGSETNTFTFTVVPVFENLPATYDYTYVISLPNGGSLQGFSDGSSSVTGFSGGTVSRDETNVGDAHVYTITFTTTTGISTETLTATLNLTGSNLTLPTSVGGGVYAATQAATGVLTQSVTVNAVPTIGQFN